ncbi:hypothetical protein OH492_28850 [Vibrio chagasii]|nr:hypothetical protein [Vibrio chagasii]
MNSSRQRRFNVEMLSPRHFRQWLILSENKTQCLFAHPSLEEYILVVWPLVQSPMMRLPGESGLSNAEIINRRHIRMVNECVDSGTELNDEPQVTIPLACWWWRGL